MKKRDLSGQKIGKWSLLSLNKKGNKYFYECVCDCGKNFNIAEVSLIKGSSTGCRNCRSNRTTDYTGHIFGKLKVLNFSHIDGKRIYWQCECECGTKELVNIYYINTGNKYACKKCMNECRTQDLTNKKINKLLVIKLHSGKSARSIWECSCECGNKINVKHSDILSYKIKECNDCKFKESTLPIGYKHHNMEIISHKVYKRSVWVKTKCLLCNEIAPEIQQNHFIKYTPRCQKCVTTKKYFDISLGWFNNVKDKANRRKIKFELAIEDIWDIFLKQDKKCALTGIDIKFKSSAHKSMEQTASVDRIDSKLGYTKDNIQIVHKKVNFMKHTNSQNDFIILCNFIAKKHPVSLDENCIDFPNNCVIKRM